MDEAERPRPLRRWHPRDADAEAIWNYRSLERALHDPHREQGPRAPARHDRQHEPEGGAAEDGEAEDPLAAVALGQEPAADVVSRYEPNAVRIQILSGREHHSPWTKMNELHEELVIPLSMHVDFNDGFSCVKND